MSLADYSSLEKEISSAKDPQVLPRGTEANVRIIAVRSGVSDKNGATWYQPVFDVPSDPMVQEFNDFIWNLLDGDKIEPKQKARNMNRFKNFAAAMGLDYSKPFSWEDDVVGLTGWVIVGVKKSDEYGDQNTVSKYVAGHGAGRKVLEDNF
jgi:hypothetical protein